MIAGCALHDLDSRFPRLLPSMPEPPATIDVLSLLACKLLGQPALVRSTENIDADAAPVVEPAPPTTGREGKPEPRPAHTSVCRGSVDACLTRPDAPCSRLPHLPAATCFPLYSRCLAAADAVPCTLTRAALPTSHVALPYSPVRSIPAHSVRNALRCGLRRGLVFTALLMGCFPVTA